MPGSVQFRQKARASITKAKELLLDKDERCVVYACLEVRLAIEALVYDLFERYEDQLSGGSMEKWTPKQVMAELLFIDDRIDKSSVITIKRSGTEDIVFSGEDRRFKARWADRKHHSLSSFLHQPTLSQMRSLKGDRLEAARSKVTEVIGELDDILSSPVFNVKMGQLVVFRCKCNREIARDVSFLRAHKPFSCVGCGAGYDYEENADGSFTFQLQEVTYECPSCSESNVLARHELAPGRVTQCCSCGCSFTVRTQYTLDPGVEQDK